MISQTHDTQRIEMELRNGRSVFVSSESTYELVNLGVGDWPTIEHPLLGQISACYLSNTMDLENFIPSISRDMRMILDSLTPGPVAFLIQVRRDGQLRKVLVQVPANELLLDLLKETKKPLWQTRYFDLPLTSLEMIQLLEFKEEVLVLEDQKTRSGVEPVILDLRRLNRYKIEVMRPGLWDWRELQQISPDMEVVEKFRKKRYPKPAKFRLIDSINQIPNTGLKLLLGTKEDLVREFGWIETEYFKLQEHENFLLLNMGSLASPTSILKNLFRNLNRANLLGISDVYILRPNLHRPYHLRSLLEYILESLCIEVNYTEIAQSSPVSELNIIQEGIIQFGLGASSGSI